VEITADRPYVVDRSHPSWAEVDDRDEQHPAGTLAARISAALARFGQVRRVCGTRMEIRVYDEHPTVSVVRGDGHAVPAVRHRQQLTDVRVRRRPGPGDVHRYTRHFENTWKHAEDWP
jgi:hypothetical protein